MIGQGADNPVQLLGGWDGEVSFSLLTGDGVTWNQAGVIRGHADVGMQMDKVVSTSTDDGGQ